MQELLEVREKAKGAKAIQFQSSNSSFIIQIIGEYIVGARNAIYLMGFITFNVLAEKRIIKPSEWLILYPANGHFEILSDTEFNNKLEPVVAI